MFRTRNFETGLMFRTRNFGTGLIRTRNFKTGLIRTRDFETGLMLKPVSKLRVYTPGYECLLKPRRSRVHALLTFGCTLVT